MKIKKDEVEKVKVDHECGLALNDIDVDIEEGDIIEFFKWKKVSDKLNWNPGF